MPNIVDPNKVGPPKPSNYAEDVADPSVTTDPSITPIAPSITPTAPTFIEPTAGAGMTGQEYYKFDDETYLPSNVEWGQGYVPGTSYSDMWKLTGEAASNINQYGWSESIIKRQVGDAAYASNPEAYEKWFASLEQSNPAAYLTYVNQWLSSQETMTGSMASIRGITGEGGTLGAEDAEAWNQYIRTLGVSDPMYGAFLTRDAQGNIDFASDVSITSEDFQTEYEKFGTYQVSQETGVPVEGLIEGPDGNMIPDPEEYVQIEDGQYITREQDKSLSPTEASELWDMDLDEGLIKLDELYGDDMEGRALAMQRWQQFMGATVPGTNLTYGEYFGGNIGLGPEGFTVSGAISDELAKEMISTFATWTSEGEHHVPDVEPDVGVAEPGDKDAVLSDVEAMLTEALGADDAQTIMDRLLEGYVTEGEMKTGFEETWAPHKTEWEQFGREEAASAGRMTAGTRGAGVTGAQARATAMYTAGETAARREYYTEARQYNLAHMDTVLKYTKGVGELAEAYSRTGINMATTVQIQSNVKIAEAKTWSALALDETNMLYLNKMMEVADADILWKAYQIAVGEGGYDANVLTQTANWYMNNYVGAMGDPLMALYQAWSDMQLMTSYMEGPGVGWQLAGAGMVAGGDVAAAAISRPSPSPTTATGGVTSGGATGASVGGATTVPSDKRLKMHIKYLGIEVCPGLELASWSWRPEALDYGRHGTGIGLIAQDVEELFPGAIVVSPPAPNDPTKRGILMIDYNKLARLIHKRKHKQESQDATDANHTT